MPYLYYCCIDFDEIWWKDAEDQIFSRYRVQQRALSSKKKFCDFLWKFWPKHPLPGYPKKFLRDGTTRVLFSIKNCTDLDRYQKFCQQSRGSLQLCQLQRRLENPFSTPHPLPLVTPISPQNSRNNDRIWCRWGECWEILAYWRP